jgi:hypothetical protein
VPVAADNRSTGLPATFVIDVRLATIRAGSRQSVLDDDH